MKKGRCTSKCTGVTVKADVLLSTGDMALSHPCLPALELPAWPERTSPTFHKKILHLVNPQRTGNLASMSKPYGTGEGPEKTRQHQNSGGGGACGSCHLPRNHGFKCVCSDLIKLVDGADPC